MKKILLMPLLFTAILFSATFNVSTTPELRTALTNAAQNGEDDTILLSDGTYKTTDDGKGTFVFFDNEDYNLTLKGSSAENVILSGDNQHQILNHQTIGDSAPLRLEKLSFVDGNNSAENFPYNQGGGIYSDYTINAINCIFSNNRASLNGGGFYSLSSAIVTNSTFTRNYTMNGGGFYTLSDTTVKNSIFSNNKVTGPGGTFFSPSIYGKGGGFYSSGNATVIDSTFIDNNATVEDNWETSSGASGAGFYSLHSIVNNSTFTNNNARLGGGFFSASAQVTNSSFIGNSTITRGSGFLSPKASVIDSIFLNNISGFWSSEATVTNSIFTNNNVGFYSSQNAIVTDTTFSDNSNGGFHADDANILNSVFIRNSAENGGGFYSNTASVTDCTFTDNNVSENGGGFYSNTASVTDSTFTNNRALENGGGFYSQSTTVTDSIFTRNISSNGGGFYSSGNSTVTNSTYTDNSASENGGGFRSNFTVVTGSVLTGNSANNGGGLYGGSPTIVDSVFEKNSVTNNGGGLYSLNFSSVTNSIYSENNAVTNGGAFYSNDIVVTNILLSKNSSGIYIDSNKDQNIIANSIFINNNRSDVEGATTAIISLKNNYLDTSKITVTNFKSNNIFDGVNLGFVDAINGDYNLTESSDLIDAGITSISDLTLPETDLNGNVRISGNTIDIGPYEFSSTKPTISSFTYSGTAKELSELTFSVDYTLSENRTISEVSYDYTNDGSWITSDTYTFSTAGTYTVNAKIIDSEGEYSTTSITIEIAALTFDDMTEEQKLQTAIDPEYYDAIMAIIESQKESAHTSGYESGISDGKGMVLADPASFGIEVVTPLSTTDVINLDTGWNMVAIPTEITDMNVFNDANIVWYYKDSTWYAFSSDAITASALEAADVSTLTTLPANSAVWVEK